MANRSITEQEKQEVLNEIHLSILGGMLDREIVAMVRRKWPSIKRDTIAKWVGEIYETVAQACTAYEHNRLQNLALAEARLQYMYRLAIQKGDIQAADKVHEKLMKIQGVFPDSEKARKEIKAILTGNTTINVGGHPRAIEDMSDAELARRAGMPLILHVASEPKVLEAND